MEFINSIHEITAHYARRKHQAMSGDKEALRNGIKLVTQELDTKPFGDRALEAELEYLNEALKNLEITTARDECRANAIKAQFRAQKLKERLNLRPPTKSTISEIITVQTIFQPLFMIFFVEPTNTHI